jgi:hypothetical protein
MKYLHHYKCYKVFHGVSMLLHVLIDNEQHDQYRVETNYWQNNVLKI